MQQSSVHGTLLRVFDSGLLLTGESGAGKSEAALGLLDRGHQLIADDMVCLNRGLPGELIGTAPPGYGKFMEVRGLGIFDVEKLFGVEALLESYRIDLSIKLSTQLPQHRDERLHPFQCERLLLGLPRVEYTLPLRGERNIPLLLECLVKIHRLHTDAYDALEEMAKDKSYPLKQVHV